MSSRDIPIEDGKEKKEESPSAENKAAETADGKVVAGKVAATAYQQQASQGQKPEQQSEENEESDAEKDARKDSEEKKEEPPEVDPKEELEKTVAELKDRIMRQAAEFENFRKRSQREKVDIINRATANLMDDLLPILDHFKLAMQQSPEAADDSFRKGIDLIYKQLFDALKKHGLEEIKALGEHFNPEVHEALMSEATDEHDEDSVMQVLQDGYTLKGKVIRPARVKVAKPAE